VLSPSEVTTTGFASLGVEPSTSVTSSTGSGPEFVTRAVISARTEPASSLIELDSTCADDRQL
jgi:hypothetical protein